MGDTSPGCRGPETPPSFTPQPKTEPAPACYQGPGPHESMAITSFLMHLVARSVAAQVLHTALVVTKPDPDAFTPLFRGMHLPSLRPLAGKAQLLAPLTSGFCSQVAHTQSKERR